MQATHANVRLAFLPITRKPDTARPFPINLMMRGGQIHPAWPLLAPQNNLV
jgi:hypothetical protein